MSDDPWAKFLNLVSPERLAAADDPSTASFEAQVSAQFDSESQASLARVDAIREQSRNRSMWPPAAPAFNPGFMFGPLPPPPPAMSVQTLIACAEEHGTWLDRCAAFVPAAERLRLAGRPGFSQRLQGAMAENAAALRMVHGMARAAQASQLELLRIARDAQRDVFVTQQQTHDYQQLGYALYNRAFSELQQGLQRVYCPRCGGIPQATLCSVCLGAGTVTLSVR